MFNRWIHTLRNTCKISVFEKFSQWAVQKNPTMGECNPK
jgi:hypothetical protein